MGILKSDFHIGRRSGERSNPDESRDEWIERLEWVIREAEAQIQWLDQIDASAVPPSGTSILGWWLELETLQTKRFLPLLQYLLGQEPEQEIWTRERCLQPDSSGNEENEGAIPTNVAANRTRLLTLLQELTPSEWEWYCSESDLEEGRGLLSILHDIATEDRRILREMSLQLLDRHRETLSQREIQKTRPRHHSSS